MQTSVPMTETMQATAIDAQPPANQQRRILVVSASFPSSVMPTFGVFVKERVRAIAKLPGYSVRVIAPIPYFPPIKKLSRWYDWSQVPLRETIDGLEIVRPRYPMLPKVGGYIQANLMYPGVLQAAKRIRREFDFDIIDAHFAYPAGVVGTQLGKRFGKPVVITGRGEDIHRFPESPVVGDRIRWAMRNADQFVGVSEEIAAKMISLGADPAQTRVIGNGVDCQKFQPLPRDEARRKLDLPADAQIVISVGDCFENKGFHLLVDALGRLKTSHPQLHAVIVGGSPRYGNDYTSVIKEKIAEHGLDDRVHLPGRRPHEELSTWYSAADLYSILSAREGSPNVLMEALACGVPAIGTPVGGIPEILADDRLGSVLPERSVAAAADGLTAAFAREWDRKEIRKILETHDWSSTALQVADVFDQATGIVD
ncbi:Putative teichuronic acid biosynthesis glycosyltransferase TuaC [Symmachiella dynata]|nr:Putative teichuronic acid biosynthesis glycosyltransferase TuaC [Symmachiella dynata]